MINVKNNIVALFGGVGSVEDNFKSNTPNLLNDLYILDIDEGYWSHPNIGGYIPTARCFFAMDSNGYENQNQIVVLGGRTYEKTDETAIYMLAEVGTFMISNDLLLDPASNEVWGMIDEKEKEKEQDMIKKFTNTGMTGMAKRMGQSVHVSKISLEINEAEKILADQRKQIGDLETMVRAQRKVNTEKEDKRLALQKKLEEMKRLNRGEYEDAYRTESEKNSRNNQTKQLNDRLKLLVALERKRRKFIERKVLTLQSVLRKSENFIIALDSFYIRCLKGIQRTFP